MEMEKEIPLPEGTEGQASISEEDVGEIKFVYLRLKSGGLGVGATILVGTDVYKALEAMANIALFAGRYGGRLAKYRPWKDHSGFTALFFFVSRKKFANFRDDILLHMPNISENDYESEDAA